MEEAPKSKDYPRSLYRGGTVEGEHRIVHDAEEEAAARGEGFAGLPGSNAERGNVEVKKPEASEPAAAIAAPPRRGRPPKAA